MLLSILWVWCHAWLEDSADKAKQNQQPKCSWSHFCFFLCGTGCDGRPWGGSDPEQLDGSEGERERDGHPPLRRRWQADAAGAVDQKQPDGGGGLRWGRRASQQEQKKQDRNETNMSQFLKQIFFTTVSPRCDSEPGQPNFDHPAGKEGG